MEVVNRHLTGRQAPDMNKQQMLMSAERAIKRLAKLAWHISDENLAEWIIQGDKLGECKADCGPLSA
jgi:hypothetical protein